MNLRIVPRELHNTNRPSATAQAVAFYRTLELRRPAVQRIVSDTYAPLFLTAGSQAALRSLALAAPLRHLTAQLRDLSTFVLCRHRCIDEHLLAALSDGVEQVLVLGAGYDSRAYRFVDQLAGRAVYEVDLPPLSRRKAAIVAAHPHLFGRPSVHRVEIDFRTQSLDDRLISAGFVSGARTCVVWEGVVPYLDSAAVNSTLSALHSLCGAGSTLLLDFWDATSGASFMALLRRLGAQAIALIGEPVTFYLAPTAMSSLLSEHGFEVVELADAKALTDRFATGGRRSLESLFVVTAVSN